MILRGKSRDGLMTTVFTDHVRTSNKKQLGRKKTMGSQGNQLSPRKQH